MTTQELRSLLNRVYGIEHPWPKTFEIDQDTYDNVKKSLEDWENEHGVTFEFHGKLMFKGVELILKT